MNQDYTEQHSSPPWVENKKIEKTPYCPIMSNLNDQRHCEKANCAWWADDQCAVVTIAAGTYAIKNAVETK